MRGEETREEERTYDERKARGVEMKEYKRREDICKSDGQRNRSF